MSLLTPTLCKDPIQLRDLAKVARDLKASREPVAALEFPEWSYTQTEKYSGKVTTFTTRARWVNGKYWSDADILYYEKLQAAQAQFDSDTVSQAIAETESALPCSGGR